MCIRVTKYKEKAEFGTVTAARALRFTDPTDAVQPIVRIPE
jgi:hypothetical protein